eukprot:gene7823-9291_t
MSELLKNWLRNDLAIESPVDNFETDFASGYALGEILCAAQLQPDFDKFIPKNHPDAKINNFTRLQPTLAKLGLPLDSRAANSIMTEEKGAAGRLVYLLKMALQGLHKELDASKRTGNFARTLTVATKPTLAVVETRSTKAPKAGYDSQMHKIFEDTVRVRSKNPNQIMESMHLKKFNDEMEYQAHVANHQNMQELHQTTSMREDFRNERLDLMGSQRDHKSNVTAEGQHFHHQNRVAARSMERSELRIELALNEKANRKRQAASANAGEDAKDGILAFEKNLQRLGSDDASKVDVLDKGELPQLGKTPLEHLQKIKSQLPAPSIMAQEGQAYLTRLKSKKGEEQAARKERERRRRKVLLEQQRSQQAGQERRREEALLATLQKQSKEEERIAERLWQLKQEKEVMCENRRFRESQYNTRREQDYHEALYREAELGQALKEHYKEAAALEEQRWKEAETKRQEEKRVARVKMVSEVVKELVSLAVRCAEYREQTDSLVPRKEYREWVSLFTKGVSLSPALLEDTTPPPEPDETSMVLDESTVGDYLKCSGEWALDPSELIGTNVPLGEMVHDLFHITTTDPLPPALPDLEFPIKLCLLGDPFAGKTFVSQKLADHLTLPLLEPEALVATAIEEADRYQKEEIPATPAEEAPPPTGETPPPGEIDTALDDGPPDPPPEPVIPTVVQLGREARAALEDGLDVPDVIIVRLIVQAIIKLKDIPKADTPIPVVSTPPPAAKGKDKGKKGDKGKAPKVNEPPPPPPVPKGFILDGFPRTQKQAVLLEKALTGLDLDYEASVKAKASVLAPPPKDPAEDTRLLVSGLDKVVALKCKDEAVGLKRAVGRRMDPKDGKIYHLEFDPPPADSAGLMERLEDHIGPHNDTAQAQARFTTSTAETPALDAWLGKFNSLLMPMPADSVPKEVYESVKVVADGVLEAKQALEETKLAAKAAKAARSSAEAAQESATQAKASAEAAAQQLLVAKMAEVEATAQLKENEEDQAAKEMLNEEEPIDIMLISLVPDDFPLPVDKNLAAVLYDQWQLIETSFLKGLKHTFCNLREERGIALGHFQEVKKNFLQYLRRPDRKQKLLTDFQREYNAVDLDLRRYPDAKGEMLLRAEELRDTLWDICDKKLEENEGERDAIMNDSWVADHTALLAVQFMALTQLEADRHSATCAVVEDYYRAQCHFPLLARDETQLVAPKGKLVDVSQWVPDSEPERPPSRSKAATPSKKKKGKEEEPEEPDAPAWLLPLMEQTPQLYDAIRSALDLTPERAAAKALKDAAEAELDKKGAKGKKGGEVEKTDDDILLERQNMAVKKVAQATLEREGQILERRLERLATRAQVYLAELNEAASMTRNRLEGWMAQRYQAECSAVSAVVAVIRTAADAETELPHDLRLEGEDFIESINALGLEPEPPVPPPPPMESLPPPGTLSCKQLEMVAQAFQSSAPAGILSIADCAELLAKTVLQVLDPEDTGYVEWREILTCLIVEAFPSVITGTAADLVQVADALSAADKDKDGLVTWEEFEQVKFWFQVETKDFDRPASLKKVLFTSLAQKNEKGTERVDYNSLLLYLCVAEDLNAGLEKAFKAIGKATGSVSMDQLTKITYPSGRDVGAAVGRGQYSQTDIQELMLRMLEQLYAKMGLSGGTSNASAKITFAQLVSGPEGKAFAEKMLSRYMLKKLAIS